MNYCKEIVLGSVMALSLIGCGGAGTTPASDGGGLSVSQNGLLMETSSVPLMTRMKDVGKGYSNQEAVAIDYAALKLPKYIISDYRLLTEGPAGSDINWSLLNSGSNFWLSINDDNSTLQVAGDRNKTEYAKLSAFINYDLNKSTPEANMTKTFCVTILPTARTPEEKVAQDAQIVCGNDFPKTIDLNATDPYSGCGLPQKGANDSNVTWVSSRPDIVDINQSSHTLYVPDPKAISEKTCVSIKGIFQYGDANKTACFKVCVLPQHKMLTQEEVCAMIQAAADSLKNESPALGKPLPLKYQDVDMAWVSCDTSLLTIDANGNMVNHNHSGETKEVTIRATLKLQGVCKTLCFRIELPSS